MQILTGFLLTIPFSPRFEGLGTARHAVYAGVLCSAVLATLLLMTPVVLHRALFHRGERPWLIESADRFAQWGIGFQTLAIGGVVWLILDVVASWWVAALVVALLVAFVVGAWGVLPSRERRRGSA